MENLDITYDAVSEAAEVLTKQGSSVTLHALRESLGHASIESLHPHLKTWRVEKQGAIRHQSAGLPPALSEALEMWVEEQAQAAGRGIRDALEAANDDLSALLKAQALTEQAHQQANAQCVALTAELEQMRAKLAESSAHNEQLNVELRHARDIASEALVGKAKDKLAIEGKDSQIADLRQQLERSVAVTAAAADARLNAEMELVGAVTARDNLAVEVEQLRTQLQASRAVVL